MSMRVCERCGQASEGYDCPTCQHRFVVETRLAQQTAQAGVQTALLSAQLQRDQQREEERQRQELHASLHRLESTLVELAQTCPARLGLARDTAEPAASPLQNTLFFTATGNSPQFPAAQSAPGRATPLDVLAEVRQHLGRPIDVQTWALCQRLSPYRVPQAYGVLREAVSKAVAQQWSGSGRSQRGAEQILRDLAASFLFKEPEVVVLLHQRIEELEQRITIGEAAAKMFSPPSKAGPGTNTDWSGCGWLLGALCVAGIFPNPAAGGLAFIAIILTGVVFHSLDRGSKAPKAKTDGRHQGAEGRRARRREARKSGGRHARSLKELRTALEREADPLLVGIVGLPAWGAATLESYREELDDERDDIEQAGRATDDEPDDSDETDLPAPPTSKRFALLRRRFGRRRGRR